MKYADNSKIFHKDKTRRPSSDSERANKQALKMKAKFKKKLKFRKFKSFVFEAVFQMDFEQYMSS